MTALSESEHSDRLQEASDTLHRKYCTNGSRPPRKAKMQAAREAVRVAWNQHAITQRLAPNVLADWQAWALQRTQVFQRTSSAVEGRNGYLSQMHHNQRGLPKRRYKVWTIVHNFDCRAVDGTTPASRFFRGYPGGDEERREQSRRLPHLWGKTQHDV